MKRRHLTPKAKAALWQHQGERCACCREPLPITTAHADHMAPLWATGDNGTDNFQILCIFCHARKTKRESKARAKTKRLEALRLCGREVAKAKMGKVRKLQGRPFDTSLRRKMSGQVELRRNG